MAKLGPQETGVAVPPPPPPPAPPKVPPLAMAKKQNKFDEKTEAEIARLKEMVATLNARIAKGDHAAELEYDNLKKELVDNLAAFNKTVVSVKDSTVKSLEEVMQTRTQMLEQETAAFDTRTQEMLRQKEAFKLQQARFASLKTADASKLIDQITQHALHLDSGLAKIEKQRLEVLPQLLAQKEEAKAAYTKAKEELAIAHKERDKLTALSQAVPARVKAKVEVVKNCDINFKEWVESQLLGGIFLQHLKDFIQKDSDHEVIVRCQALTNPEARKVLPSLSLNVMLAIAAGVITRPADKNYNDAMPLKDTIVDNSKQWLLELLLNDFFTANPTLKQTMASSFNVDINDAPGILRELNIHLNKVVIAAQPKETPKPIAAAASPAETLPTRVQLRKAPAKQAAQQGTQPAQAAIGAEMLKQWQQKRAPQACKPVDQNTQAAALSEAKTQTVVLK
ncbi:MAG: hypothetical protein JSR17_03920 [Proteobacteria bacterium]|nr:hypothetical protein [Pseudomonadota bacterium]